MQAAPFFIRNAIKSPNVRMSGREGGEERSIRAGPELEMLHCRHHLALRMSNGVRIFIHVTRLPLILKEKMAPHLLNLRQESLF